jgi:hypothetical protein
VHKGLPVAVAAAWCMRWIGPVATRCEHLQVLRCTTTDDQVGHLVVRSSLLVQDDIVAAAAIALGFQRPPGRFFIVVVEAVPRCTALRSRRGARSRREWWGLLTVMRSGSRALTLGFLLKELVEDSSRRGDVACTSSAVHAAQAVEQTEIYRAPAAAIADEAVIDLAAIGRPKLADVLYTVLL